MFWSFESRVACFKKTPSMGFRLEMPAFKTVVSSSASLFSTRKRHDHNGSLGGRLVALLIVDHRDSSHASLDVLLMPARKHTFSWSTPVGPSVLFLNDHAFPPFLARQTQEPETSTTHRCAIMCCYQKTSVIHILFSLGRQP